MRGKQEPLSVRFWRFVNKTEGCWIWAGGIDTAGYGFISFVKDGKGYHIRASRLAWMLAFGDIPAGLWVLHRCDNRRCVNPEHLFLGTRSDNMRDAYQKGRSSLQIPGVVPKGEAHHNAKLTEGEVREIRERAAGGEQQKALAVEYGVSGPTISCIVRNVYWRE